MKELLPNKIENIIRNGYRLDFGQVIEQTFANYKKIALMQGAILLVILLIFTVVIGSVAGLAFGVGSLTEYFTDYDVNEISSVALLINFAVTVVAAGIAAPLTAGLLKMAHNAEMQVELEFSTVFEYYKSAYFKELFIVGILISLFVEGIDTAVTLLVQDYVQGITGTIISFVSGIIGVVVAIVTLFAIPLIIFENLSATAAINGSISIIKQKFWTILAIEIIVILCAILGIFGFCIGIFFSIPLVYSSIYILYRNVVGIDEKSKLDEIGVDLL